MFFWGAKKKRIKETYLEKCYERQVYLFIDDYKDIRDNHSVPHPEIETHAEIVRRAIEDPAQVNQDKESARKLCYYATFDDSDPTYAGLYMKVVLVINPDDTMYIATVMGRNNILQQGETKIWPI